MPQGWDCRGDGAKRCYGVGRVLWHGDWPWSGRCRLLRQPGLSAGYQERPARHRRRLRLARSGGGSAVPAHCGWERAITDAVTETFHVVNVGRAHERRAVSLWFAGCGARLLAEDGIKAGSNPMLETVTGHSQWGQRSLAFPFRGLVPGSLRAPAPVPTRIATVPKAVGGSALFSVSKRIVR